MEKTIEVEFYGLNLVVNYIFREGYPGDNIEALEPNDVDIMSVYLEGIDIYELLNNSYNYVRPNYKHHQHYSKITELEELILSEL